MGASASTQVHEALSGKVQDAKNVDRAGVIELLMPVYYTSSPLLPHEKEHAIKAWKLISSGLAPEFHRRKKNDPLNTPCTSPPEFFGKRLVKRFVDLHPVSQHMFSNTTTKQGTLFFRMIAFIVTALEDDEKFESHFVMLAKGHNSMGVRAVEYGIFGEALFHVLRYTLGEDYTSLAHMGWVKIFSRVLRVVIPVVVDYELSNKPLVAKLTAKRVSKMPLMNNGPLTVTLDADEKDNESVHSIHSTMTSVVPYNRGTGGSQ